MFHSKILYKMLITQVSTSCSHCTVIDLLESLRVQTAREGGGGVGGRRMRDEGGGGGMRVEGQGGGEGGAGRMKMAERPLIYQPKWRQHSSRADEKSAGGTLTGNLQ